jgi:hypothetical protein
MTGLIKKYKEEQVFACVSKDSEFHETMWPTLKRAAFVLWINRTTTFSCKCPTFNLNITLRNASAFLFSGTETDSIRYNGYLNVTADRVGYGEGCTSLSGINASRTDVTSKKQNIN